MGFRDPMSVAYVVKKAGDIIFSGTEKRKPMSAAEVTLV